MTATFELPGFTSEGVAIDIHQNRLTVSGESTTSDSEEGRDYVVRERRSGKFSRMLQLPFGTKVSLWSAFSLVVGTLTQRVQPDDVKAKMENGVLTITFPKTSPEQEAKRIVIE